ncbi:MAG: flippase-like domain-containing protein [Methanomethylovorans sp.]|jgi:hypothetical protein|nr:flippase-like domain-containing protein [Methanomethylovorans sp.]
MKSKKRRVLSGILYISLTIAVIVLIGVLDPQIKDLPEALKRFELFWLLACVGSLLMFWLTDALLLHDITTYIYKKVPLRHSIKVGLIGLYYGALTPFATGGQPMQVVYMKRRKIPFGTSICIVGIKFLIYELSICFFFIISMFARGAAFYTENNQMFWLTIFGFAINLLLMFMIVLTLFNKKLVLRAGRGIVRLLARIKLIKNKEQVLHSFETSIDEYQTAASYLSKYKLRALRSFLISLVNLSFLFIIPYFIYRAFGLKDMGVLDILTLQAFLYLAVSFIPTPGSSGAAEGGFYFFFKSIFPQGTIVIGMLVWRFLTYYLMLIMGSILVVLDEVFTIRCHEREKAQAKMKKGED